MPSIEHVPVPVPDLVAQVSEQGAVRLGELHPQGLAVRVVALGEIDRDHAAVVPGDHRRRPRSTAGRRRARARGSTRARRRRQAEVVELEDQPAFGRLGCGERGQPGRVGVVGTGAGELAAAAQPVRRRPGRPASCTGRSSRLRAAPRRFVEHDELGCAAVEAQPRPAGHAHEVLEEDQTAAGAAGEGAHCVHANGPSA